MNIPNCRVMLPRLGIRTLTLLAGLAIVSAIIALPSSANAEPVTEEELVEFAAGTGGAAAGYTVTAAVATAAGAGAVTAAVVATGGAVLVGVLAYGLADAAIDAIRNPHTNPYNSRADARRAQQERAEPPSNSGCTRVHRGGCR